MTLSDLLFLTVAAATIAAVVRIGYLAMRRRGTQARRALGRLAGFWALYLGGLIAVSLAAPQRVLAMKEDECFDDWCLAVDFVEQAPRIADEQAKGNFWLATLRVSSRAKRVSQRAKDATVCVLDTRGRWYDPSPKALQAAVSLGASDKPLNSLLAPGESFVTLRVFDLPDEVKEAGLVVEHGKWPGRLIIGNSQSLLHRPTVIRLLPALPARCFLPTSLPLQGDSSAG